MKSTYTLLFFIFFIKNLSFSQELIVNGGFELENKCSEYRQYCSPVAWYSTSDKTSSYGYVENIFKAKKGKRYSFIVVNDYTGRQYIQTWLGCPVEAGKKYQLSFLLRKNDKYDFMPFGLFFSNQFEEIVMKNFQDERSHIIIEEKNIAKKLRPKKWSRVNIEFTAPIDAEFMTVGNFDVYVPKINVPIPKWRFEYEEIRYFLDDFSLKPLVETPPCSNIEQRTLKIVEHHLRHSHNSKTNLKEEIEIETALFEKPKNITKNTIDSPNIKVKKAPQIITLPSVFFEFDKYEIQEKYRDEILAALQPLVGKTFSKLEIIGHTDNKGNEKYNKTLSFKRAETIRNLMIINNLAKENQILIEGKGAQNPVADNNLEEGRQKNRRVEVLIFW